MTGRTITAAELAERIERLHADLREFRVETRTTYVQREVYEAQQVTTDLRISRIERVLWWLQGIVGAAFLTAIVRTVIKT